ncbi:hypothetical protein GcM1_173008, partial [Golovinomyces cichoracearum]
MENLRGEITNFGKQINLSNGTASQGNVDGDYSLWEAFVYDFEGFTKTTFDNADKDLLRKFRDFLRSNGVFVFKQHEWTDEDIRDQMNDAQGLNSNIITHSNSIIKPFQNTSQINSPIKTKNDSSQTKPQISTSGRDLVNLMKMYDRKLKYSGFQDGFDFKLTIFYDLCTKAGINPDAYSSSFSTMLRDDALDYFYDSINHQGLSFNIMCSMIKYHFEKEEHKKAMMTTQNSIHTQRGLSSEFRSEKCLRVKVINAYNDIEACAYACLKPSSSLEGLCSDLRSSMITFNRIRETNHPSSNQNIYTGRLYRGANHKFRPQNSKLMSKKKCFVCNKEGCWSNKNSEEERSIAINKFKQSFQKSVNKNDDKHVHQYISESENCEQDNSNWEYTHCDSNEEELQYDLEAIVNDAQLFEDETNQLISSIDSTSIFITEFGDINGQHTISKFNDLSTYHLITKTNLNSLNTDPFAYTTGNGYTSDNYFGIMIDTGASNRSTADYGQFMAYKSVNKNTFISTSKA